LNSSKDEIIFNFKNKFEDLFKRHEVALNTINELSEKNKFLEAYTKRDGKQGLYPSNNPNGGVNLGVLMMSEKEINDDILKEDIKAENYTINMRVNIKKFNNQHNLFNHGNLRGARNSAEAAGLQINPNLDNQKKQDIMVISEEIYQKRISKVCYFIKGMILIKSQNSLTSKPENMSDQVKKIFLTHQYLI